MSSKVILCYVYWPGTQFSVVSLHLLRHRQDDNSALSLWSCYLLHVLIKSINSWSALLLEVFSPAESCHYPLLHFHPHKYKQSRRWFTAGNKLVGPFRLVKTGHELQVANVRVIWASGVPAVALTAYHYTSRPMTEMVAAMFSYLLFSLCQWYWSYRSTILSLDPASQSGWIPMLLSQIRSSNADLPASPSHLDQHVWFESGSGRLLLSFLLFYMTH